MASMFSLSPSQMYYRYYYYFLKDCFLSLTARHSIFKGKPEKNRSAVAGEGPRVQACEPRFFTSARPAHLCNTGARLKRKQTASVSSWQPSATPRSSPQRITPCGVWFLLFFFTYFLLGWVKIEFYFSTHDFISVIFITHFPMDFVFFALSLNEWIPQTF